MLFCLIVKLLLQKRESFIIYVDGILTKSSYHELRNGDFDLKNKEFSKEHIAVKMTNQIYNMISSCWWHDVKSIILQSDKKLIV